MTPPDRERDPETGATSPPDHQRGLQDGFYAPTRSELRESIREAEHARSAQMESLAEASGIKDVAMLEQLVVAGVGCEALAALTLYPLVAVAWADGRIDARERETVLGAAERSGLAPDSTSYRLLVDWLDHTPPDALLLAAWKGLVAELCAEMDEAARARFETEILGRTRAVANASGGFLALDKTSNAEQRVLDELMSAFRESTGQ